MTKILITTACFAKTDKSPLELLESKGCECVLNTTGLPYTKEQMIEAVADVDGVILGSDPCDAQVLSAAPRLRVVSRFGVGADNVDTDYCDSHGIAFYRTVGANADGVADTTLALMLAVSKRIAAVDAMVRRGEWPEPDTFEICHKTLGLVGFGNIGAKVARRARGFEMEVVAYDAFRNEALAETVGAHYADTLEEVLERADVVSIHVPHTPETHHLIDGKALGRMKPGAILINTARGGIVDEAALAGALRDGRLMGAGLDVFEHEPLEKGSPLFDCPNLVLSPHAAGDTVESLRKVSEAAAGNLLRGLGLG
jgi:D-3-phosphoglycerate dehydrogenase